MKGSPQSSPRQPAGLGSARDAALDTAGAAGGGAGRHICGFFAIVHFLSTVEPCVMISAVFSLVGALPPEEDSGLPGEKLGTY